MHTARAASDRDDGIALITVLGVIALVTVLVTAGFALARQALHESTLVNQESQAFQAANAALDAAVAQIQFQGYDPDRNPPDFPKHFASSATGAGEATVTVQMVSKNEYLLVAVGVGRDGTQETVRVRMYFIDLYGMNVSYGARLNGGSAGKINGTTDVYGPLYTFGSLDDSNVPGGSGGYYWGPLMVKGGDVVDPHGAIVVSAIYYEPPHTVSTGANPQPRLVPEVPEFVVPPVDSTYLANALARAVSESSDNNQGEPLIRPGITNHEVSTLNTPSTYTHVWAPGASTHYKVIDDDGVVNKSLTAGLTLNSSTPSFGDPSDDFAWNLSTLTLTVWGTVLIDGPLTTDGDIHYVGNGVLVTNGPIQMYGNMTPLNGLLPGLGGIDGTTEYLNQSFSSNECLGFVSPDNILIDRSGNNSTGPETPPTHAGAFYCVNPSGVDPDLGIIQLGSKVACVGSVIARGIDFLGNNNQHLRTSANLGQCVSKTMPGYGKVVQSFGTWARQ